MKQRVKIQNILFPTESNLREQDMYFKIIKGQAQFLNGRLCIEPEAEVSFAAYFNNVSIRKWKKYADVDKYKININLKGRAKISPVGYEHIEGRIKETCFEPIFFDNEGGAIATYEFANTDMDICSFIIKAVEYTEVFGGFYEVEAEQCKIRNVKLGIGICTFKREKFVSHNLDVLNHFFLKNKESELMDKLEVFISDNGKSLNADALSSSHIHIFPNKNYGGAGGFTRTLMEMRFKDRSLTHVILMDDDIVIEPEAIFRTYVLLRLVKDEYKDAFIGGAMCRLDVKYIQEESGAVWNDGNLRPLKHGLDLRELKECLLNEKEEKAEYQAWWYCCFPIGVVREDNLPMPVFVYGDDLEYGLRNMENLILLNGICVWHEPFENKYSASGLYYLVRNICIDCSFHASKFGLVEFYRIIWKRCIKEILMYRYENVDIYLKGARDFLKGPEWLKTIDAEQLHQRVMKMGYQQRDINELDFPFNKDMFEKSLYGKRKVNKVRKFLTLNGLLLPAVSDNIVPMGGKALLDNYYRKKSVLCFDSSSQRGFIVRKSYYKMFTSIFKMIKVSFLGLFKFKKAKHLYETSGKELQKLEFWEKYLDIDDGRKFYARQG